MLGKQESESLADAGKVSGYTTNTIVIDYPVDLLHALAECEAKQFSDMLLLRCPQV